VTLEWQPMPEGARGYLSSCRKYSVCSVTIQGQELWEAWKLAPGGPWFAPLQLGLANEEDAKRAAEEDRAK